MVTALGITSSSSAPWLGDDAFGGMSPASAEASWRATQRRREEEAAWARDHGARHAEAPAPPGVAASHVEPRLDELPLTIEHWRTRDLPKPDFLLGSWLSTTNRVLISAPTGLGKSNLVIALGQHVAAGLPFLHWKSGRRARVLYIDGEMSRQLLKERIFAEERRHGGNLDGFFALNHDDVTPFRPLNTSQGQAWILGLIQSLRVELVIFDNIMSLTFGDQTNELVWQQTMPLVLALTARSVAQIWVHHTGHDETKGYGTKTREWSLDTVIHLEAVKRGDTDVSFSMAFKKARERTPATRFDSRTSRSAWCTTGGSMRCPSRCGTERSPRERRRRWMPSSTSWGAIKPSPFRVTGGLRIATIGPPNAMLGASST